MSAKLAKLKVILLAMLFFLEVWEPYGLEPLLTNTEKLLHGKKTNEAIKAKPRLFFFLFLHHSKTLA